MEDQPIKIDIDRPPPAWGAGQGAGQPAQPAPSSPSLHKDLLGLRLLPGEEILRASRRTVLTPMPEVRDGLFLTNLRVIYAGRLRQWGVFPRGRVVRSAFVADVDVGGMRTRRLSAAWLLVGLVLFALGIAALNTDDEAYASNFGALWIVVGIGCVGLWLLVRREGIAFAVAGDDAFAHWYFQLSAQDRTAMIEFLNAFFELKQGVEPSRAAPPSPRGIEV